MKKSELRQLIKELIAEQLGSAGPRPTGPRPMGSENMIPPKWFYSRFKNVGDVYDYLELGIKLGLKGPLLNQAQSQLERPMNPETPIGPQPKGWFTVLVGLLSLGWKIYVYGANEDGNGADPPWWE